MSSANVASHALEAHGDKLQAARPASDLDWSSAKTFVMLDEPRSETRFRVPVGQRPKDLQ
ncbi:hypothetical protein ASD35_03515 [Pelomonas sp. Root1444]|nr:hypothetical protein ASD35_03515 [Pelomonas sp. Root1444]